MKFKYCNRCAGSYKIVSRNTCLLSGLCLVIHIHFFYVFQRVLTKFGHHGSLAQFWLLELIIVCIDVGVSACFWVIDDLWNYGPCYVPGLIFLITLFLQVTCIKSAKKGTYGWWTLKSPSWSPAFIWNQRPQPAGSST